MLALKMRVLLIARKYLAIANCLMQLQGKKNLFLKLLVPRAEKVDRNNCPCIMIQK